MYNKKFSLLERRVIARFERDPETVKILKYPKKIIPSVYIFIDFNNF